MLALVLDNILIPDLVGIITSYRTYEQFELFKKRIIHNKKDNIIHNIFSFNNMLFMPQYDYYYNKKRNLIIYDTKKDKLLKSNISLELSSAITKSDDDFYINSKNNIYIYDKYFNQKNNKIVANGEICNMFFSDNKIIYGDVHGYLFIYDLDGESHDIIIKSLNENEPYTIYKNNIFILHIESLKIYEYDIETITLQFVHKLNLKNKLTKLENSSKYSKILMTEKYIFLNLGQNIYIFNGNYELEYVIEGTHDNQFYGLCFYDGLLYTTNNTELVAYEPC
jgi:hypothetical protein